MPGKHTAEADLEAVRAKRAALEIRMIALLERGADKRHIEAAQNELNAADDRIEELQAVLQSEAIHRAAALPLPEMHRACFVATRSKPSPERQSLSVPCYLSDPTLGDVEQETAGERSVVPLGLEPLVTATNEWRLEHESARVTGALIATAALVYGVVEGPPSGLTAALEKLRASKEHWSGFRVIARHGATSGGRLFTKGLSVTVVPDGILAHILETAAEESVVGRAFTPEPTLSLMQRGGNPLGVAPDGPKPVVSYALILDSRCGVTHRPQRYKAAAAIAVREVRAHGGNIVEPFGDVMTAYFSVLDGVHLAVAAALAIHKQVRYAVQSLHVGPAVIVNSPDVTAYGKGFRDATSLVFAAESDVCRRPIVLSPAAADKTNRAHQPLQVFTVNGETFFAPASLAEDRLEPPPEPELFGKYDPGPEPEEGVPEPAATSGNAAFTPNSVHQGRLNFTPFVRGAKTEDELQALFRKLDKGNCGWIGKDAFREAVSKDEDFPKCVDELAQRAMEGWLDQCRKAGERCLTFNEFVRVCLKLEALG